VAEARRRRARVGTVIAATLLAVGICEIALRNIGGVFDDTFMRPDFHRGWSLRPGFAGWTNAENILWVEINADGMRDRDHPIVAPPGTLRVAVLGDSFMQGLNVELAKTFHSFLEQRLQDCLRPTGLQVDVLNFGVSGYGTAQQWLTYTHHAATYRPDVVILSVYTDNDITDNYRLLNEDDFVGRTPYFTLNGDALVLDSRFRDLLAADAHQPWWRRTRVWIQERVRVAQLVYDGWGALRPFLIDDPEDEVQDIDRDEADPYRPPQTAEWREAWRITEALILALARDVAREGSEPWIVTLANSPQVEPEAAARQEFAARLGSGSLFYPDRRIASFAREHGLRSIALAEPLADYTARERAQLFGGYMRSVPFGEGHWNEHANRVAADLVAQRICVESDAFRRATKRRSPDIPQP
jgi:hypothetical protein